MLGGGGYVCLSNYSAIYFCKNLLFKCLNTEYHLINWKTELFRLGGAFTNAWDSQSSSNHNNTPEYNAVLQILST